MSRRSQAKRQLLKAALSFPDRVRRVAFGRPPTNDRGVRLDGDLHVMLALSRVFQPDFDRGEPSEARERLLRSVEVVESQPAPLLGTEDVHIAGVACRRYRPRAGKLPRFVYLHGGGWVVGDLRSHDRFCRRLASGAGVEVIAVDYPLAPEHPYPEGLHGVLAVWRELAAVDGPMALGGDSAGGNLTAAACVALRDAGERLPDLEVLIYPGTDRVGDHPSRRHFAEGFLLTAASIDWYNEMYGGDDPRDPLLSPRYADVHGLPPAIVTTAGFDPLRDEGEVFAANLREAGVPVTHLDEADLIHGYLQMDGVIPAASRGVAALIVEVDRWARGVGR
ncbi:MAG: alpha/beta hydrolase [Deltaproteobacteria bacterium]|nr:MAG: alpha/beta hydrolase [Deltaproteobacteria bacterium]